MDLHGTLDQLSDMCHISALSGCEENMIRYMKGEMLKCTSHVSVDNLGNVIARIDGTSKQGSKVMVLAHMDEVGFMVRKIEPDGFLRITRVGGPPEKSLAAQRVEVQTDLGPVFGVIGVKAHHITPIEDRLKVVPINDVFVDIGATSKSQAIDMGVHVGAPITYAGFFREMAGGQIAGKSIDNRGGCFILLQVLRLLSQNKPRATVYAVGTVQEEFSIRGVVTAGYVIEPDLAIGLDGSPAADTPDLRAFSDSRCGGGPIVNHYTFHPSADWNGLIPNPKLRRYVTNVAAQLDIPVQFSAFVGSPFDTAYLTVVGKGIPCVDVCFPMRYSHAAVEVANASDLAQATVLVTSAVEQIDSSLDLTRG